MNLEDAISLCVNGVEHRVPTSDLRLETTLNTFLRSNLNLTGTKRMCLEGGCGACIVAVEQKNHVTNKTTLRAINSCLVPLFLCNGWRIQTIEGITPKTDYHYLQKTLSHFNGSQCGFCSPGMVMNMYSLCQEKKMSMKEVENSFGGNICRCTGYRSILSAFKAVCEDASPELLKELPDIEDLKVCQKSSLMRFSNNKKKSDNPIYFNLGKTTWIKVSLLNDLLQILKTFSSSTYMLVAGNTSAGVYKPKTVNQIYVDITDIEELTSFKIENDSLILGANLSLTEAMTIFDKISKEFEKFAYLGKLSQHIDLIANVPVRNLGTLAGNLMIKYHHHEFPSDIFLILEAAGALLQIVDSDGHRAKMPIGDLIKGTLTGKVIEKIILPALSPSFKYESYKIMPRAQNAHALVNAGFLLELNENNIVLSARIVYGSINPAFIHAQKTESFLKGQDIFNNDTLQKTYVTLESEINPDLVPSEPTPVFRRKLAIALFYKYILSIAPRKFVSSKDKSGASALERPLTTGSHDFETHESFYPVSRPTIKTESLAQTSGQAEYIIDMPDLPGQLFGAFVLAKIKPMSLIRKIDTSEAMKLKGVVAFFTKDDIPGQNNFTPLDTNIGVATKEEIFCSGEVQYYNQPIGLIVANSQDLAERAASLVTVAYNAGNKQPRMTINDAVKGENGKCVLQKEIEPKWRGDNTKHVVRGKFEMGPQYHYHMETQCCNVVYTEDGLDMYPSSQWLELSQSAAASTLNIPANKINVFVRRLGGGFGGKLLRNSLISCAAALAAYKLKKPVKIWLPLEINMNMIGKRYPIQCEYEMGVDNTGIIQYLDTTFYSDYGVASNEPNIPFVLEMMLESYNTNSWHLKAFSTHTNNAASCYTRAPGTCEGLAMIESIMEHAAMQLDMNSTDFRLRNIDKEKHEDLAKFIQELQEWADIDNRRREIEKFNQDHRWKKRGMAVVPMVFKFIMFANYGVIVSIYRADGSVSVAHGGVEMGQGINTKVAQVCAYKLGIPLEKVSVKPSNNLIAPNAHMSGGSITSETVCHGVIQACDILLKRMEPIKKQLEGATWQEIVTKCYYEFIDLSATAMGSPKDLKDYSVYGVCACEVELDVLTGQYMVQRVDLLEDAGTSMNANIDMGQVEGAFVMGMGYFTSEKIVYKDDGELLTNRTWNYKPPGAKDIPVDFRIKFSKNTPNGVGVLHSKAIGEPPLCLACSVPLAIRNAVAAVRTDVDETSQKWFPFSGPSTVENVFMNCLHDFKQYTL